MFVTCWNVDQATSSIKDTLLFIEQAMNGIECIIQIDEPQANPIKTVMTIVYGRLAVSAETFQLA